MTAKHAWRRGALLAVLPLALALPGAAPASAAGPQPFLAGLTSQTQPVILRFSPDGTVLARAYTTLHMKCTSGATFYVPDNFANLDVSKLRHFGDAFSVPPTTQGDTSGAVTGSITGQVDRTGTRVSGTWRQTLVERNVATQAITDTCTSGLVHFSAHR
jgi:hypothetical protein